MSCAVHLDSVGMLMRILTMTVINFTARCTEQIVWVGNVWYLPASKFLESSQRHGKHSLRFFLFILSASSRGLEASQLRPQRLTAHSLQNKKIDSSHFSTLYNINYCFIRVKSSSVRPSFRSIFLFSSFFPKRTAEFSLFWQPTTDRQYWSHGRRLCTMWNLVDNVRDCSTGWSYLICV